MRKNKPQNLNEQLSRMKRLINFDIAEHSHDNLAEQEYKKVVKEQNRTEMSRDEIIKNYDISGPLYDTIKGIKSVTFDKENFKVPKEPMVDLYMDNYVTPNDAGLTNYLESNVYPMISSLITNGYKGTLTFKVDSGASSVPATNGYGGANPPNHNFSEYGKQTGGLLPNGKWDKNNPSQVKGGNKFLATQRGLQLINAIKNKLSSKFGNTLNFNVIKGEKFGVVGDTSNSAKFVDLGIDGTFSRSTPTVNYDIDFNFSAEYMGGSKGSRYPYQVKISIGGSNQHLLTKTFGVQYEANMRGVQYDTFYKSVGFGMFDLSKIKDAQGVRLDGGTAVSEQFDVDQVGSVTKMMSSMGFGISLGDVASALGWGLPKIAKGPFYSDVEWGKGDFYCTTTPVSINVNANYWEWEEQRKKFKLCKPTYKKTKYSTEELLAGLNEVYPGKVPKNKQEIIANLHKSGVFETP
jgi:hypothetical protein